MRFVGSNVNELYDLVRESAMNAEPLWEVPRRKAEGRSVSRSVRLIPTNLTAVDDVVHRLTVPLSSSTLHRHTLAQELSERKRWNQIWHNCPGHSWVNVGSPTILLDLIGGGDPGHLGGDDLHLKQNSTKFRVIPARNGPLQRNEVRQARVRLGQCKQQIAQGAAPQVEVGHHRRFSSSF